MENRRKRINVEYLENKKDKKRTTKWKYICLVMAVAMVFIYYQVYILISYTMGKNVTENQIALYKWMVGVVNKEENVDSNSQISIAVLGNIKAKGELLESYSNKGTVDYSSIFENISFEEYDYTIANLNTAIVRDTKSKGEFYANGKIIKELKNINIDMLVTSTKELGEQSDKTIEETLKAISEHEIDIVGAKNNKYYILDKNDIKIAFLAYTGEEYVDNDSINMYSRKKLRQDIKEVQKKEVDGIIVFVDTLRNNQTKVKEDKNRLLHEILEEGADIVISNDTVEQKLYENADKNKHIKYSLGDVIGPQETDNSDISKVLKIIVKKEVNEGKTKVYLELDDSKALVALSNSDMTKYKIVDLDKEILNFDETSSRITVAEYNYLKNIKKDLNN